MVRDEHHAASPKPGDNSFWFTLTMPFSLVGTVATCLYMVYPDPRLGTLFCGVLLVITLTVAFRTIPHAGRWLFCLSFPVSWLLVASEVDPLRHSQIDDGALGVLGLFWVLFSFGIGKEAVEAILCDGIDGVKMWGRDIEEFLRGRSCGDVYEKGTANEPKWWTPSPNPHRHFGPTWGRFLGSALCICGTWGALAWASDFLGSGLPITACLLITITCLGAVVGLAENNR